MTTSEVSGQKRTGLKKVAPMDSDIEVELPEVRGKLISLHEPKISERRKRKVEISPVEETVAQAKPAEDKSEQVIKKQTVEDKSKQVAKKESVEDKGQEPKTQQTVHVNVKQQAKAPVAHKSETAKRTEVKVSVAPKKEVAKQADTPKVILHKSRLITDKPSLPKAPAPIYVDRVQQVALQDTEQKGSKRRSLKNDVVRPQKNQRQTHAQQVQDISSIQEQVSEIQNFESRQAQREEKRQDNQFYSRGQQIDLARVHQQVRDMAVQSQETRRQQSGRELKEQAIRQAMTSAERQVRPAQKQHEKRMKFGMWRVLLALSCAAAAAFGIVYLVDMNSTSAPMKVAAMQSGIDASYPSYVPRGFDLSDITSEDGKITLNFKNSETGDSFTLIEEQLTGNFDAVLQKYVSDTYGKDAMLVQESGATTFYQSGSNAAWVSDAVLYKLIMTKGSFTKKQITNIVKSI